MSPWLAADRSPARDVQVTVARLVTSLLIICSLIDTAAQTNVPSAAISPAFDVASAKQSPPPTGGPMFVTYGPRAGGQWLAQNAPFLMILRSAYPDFSLPGQIDGGSEWVKQSTVGRPVIDRTGLTGRWDIELEYSITTTPSTAADQANAPTSVFTAVQEQLGLRLESQKEKLEVLVIDQIELPTAN